MLNIIIFNITIYNIIPRCYALQCERGLHIETNEKSDKTNCRITSNIWTYRFNLRAAQVCGVYLFFSSLHWHKGSKIDMIYRCHGDNLTHNTRDETHAQMQRVCTRFQGQYRQVVKRGKNSSAIQEALKYRAL